MKTQMEQIIDHHKNMEALKTLRQMSGMVKSPHLDLLEAVANAGLPSSAKAFEMAGSLCAKVALARQLMPVVTAKRTPPANQRYVIIGEDPITGENIFLLNSELCRGLGIVGGSGSGKTVTLYTLLCGIPEDVFLYAPDAKREVWRIFRNLPRRVLYVRPNERYINILECPTSDPVTYYTGLMDVWSRPLDLDDSTWPEVAGLLIEIRLALPKDKPMLALGEFPAVLEEVGERRKKAKFNTAAARFRVLAFGYGDAAWVRRGPDLASRYSGLGMDYTGVSHRIRHVTDAHYLYAHMQICNARGHKNDLDFVLVCDEGLDVFGHMFGTQSGSGHVSFQDIVTSQGRSFGLGRIITFQFVGQGDASVLNNSAAIIALPVSDHAGARAVAGALNIPVESAAELQDLPPLEGYVKTPTFTPAVRLKVQYTELGPYPSDVEIQAVMEPEIRWMRENSIMAARRDDGKFTDIDYSVLLGYSAAPVVLESAVPPVKEQVAPETAKPLSLVADWAAFLAGVEANPDISTSGLYSVLRLSGYRGNKLKSELLNAGLIAVERIKTTGRPSDRITMTKLGQLSLEDFKRHESRK
jgi:hypothetical protein